MQITEILAAVPTFVWWTAGAIVTAGITLTGFRATLRAARSSDRRPSLESTLTIAVACIATGVSAQGMWRFFGDVLGFDGPLRVLLFAFIELAVMTSAVRARRNMRENYSAGIDGVAVWVLACLTAVLSSMDARSAAEAVFRLAAPLVAAWLWDRGMAIEHRRITGRARIHWRITPERVLVRLGLAEATDRTASEVDAHRRLTRVAKAAKRARVLEQAGARKGKLRRALARLDRAVEKAVEHANLAADADRQRQLLDQIGAIFAAGDLRHLPALAPWSTIVHPLTATQGEHKQVHTEVNTPVHTEVNTTAPVDTASNEPSMDTPVFTDPVTSMNGEVNTAATIECTPASTPETVTTVTEPVTSSGADSEQPSDRERPDDQDNREAEKWIRGRIRAGRVPTLSEVSDRFGFSRGWARLRVQAARAEMTAKGYRILPGNRVEPPAVNGSPSDHADDVPMTPVEVK